MHICDDLEFKFTRLSIQPIISYQPLPMAFLLVSSPRPDRSVRSAPKLDKYIYREVSTPILSLIESNLSHLHCVCARAHVHVCVLWVNKMILLFNPDSCYIRLHSESYCLFLVMMHEVVILGVSYTTSDLLQPPPTFLSSPPASPGPPFAADMKLWDSSNAVL